MNLMRMLKLILTQKERILVDYISKNNFFIFYHDD